MMELKATTIYDAYWKSNSVGEGTGILVYLKPDVDEVIAELKEERRWRKFSEEKPERHQWILVFYPSHSQFTTGVELRRWDDGCKYDVEVQEIYEEWMPLPSAPKEAK